MPAIPSPRKSLGQHWLEDESTLENICEIAELNKDDLILEIGPGYGSLTKLLVERVSSVVAVELDTSLANELKTFVHAPNLMVVNDSILKFDLTSIKSDYKIVANIPYYLTGNLLRLLSETSNPPSLIVLLVQKEVAERVAAKPGEMSLLSVTTQYYWEVSLDRVVPAELFVPPPKVDSQIILMKKRTKVLFADINDRDFFRVVKMGFSSRRKTILNSLAGGLRLEKARVSEVIEMAGIDPNTRPQNLSLNDWYKIYKTCVSEKIV
jgi:16S rRNA (adenine1518-N6/adenine1519-N6)-dimethyltransferase